MLTIHGLENHNHMIGAFVDHPQAKIEIHFVGKHASLTIGRNVRCHQVKFFLAEGAVVVIGDDCELSGQIRCTNFCQISVGDRTRILGKSRIHAHERVAIEIGKDCLIEGLHCRTSDSHKIFDGAGQRLNTGQPIGIEDGVYIAAGVHLYKGVHVGAGSAILAGSQVFKSIPAQSAACGSPAQVYAHPIAWQSA